MKIDLHVHSRFSTRPSQWILQKLNCPESFTEPERLYRIARERGMDMVTITDHNTIAGSLAIAHLPDTFVSVEITTYFPNEGCKIHVLALDISEDDFAEIQRVRENIFDLVPLLRSRSITHVCAHPLYAINDRLTLEHVEQLLVLFNTFEQNGARDGAPNQALTELVASLTPETIEHLAHKHGLEPLGETPWKKSLTGGSDDHSSLNIARLHTEVPGATDLASFKAGILQGRSIARGLPAQPETMAHNLYAIAYQFYKTKFRLDRFVNRDITLRFADRFLTGETPPEGGVIDRVQAYWQTRRYLRKDTSAGQAQDVIRREAARLILDDPELARIARNGRQLPERPGQEWFRFVTRAANRVLTHFADHLLGHLSGGNICNIFQSVGSAAALYTFLAPYFMAYSLYQQDRRFADQVRGHFAPEGSDTATQPAPSVKVAHFTDTYREVNGVALTMRRNLAIAQATGRDMTMITCYPEDGAAAEVGVRNFAPIGVFNLPEYPELSVNYPPVLEMLAHAFREGYTHLHTATPGPVGLAALLISRILKLPIHGTYHTQIPQYARKLTGDDAMEDLTWKYTLWYYGQLDMIYAPSQATADELIARGISSDKVRIYPRGVDTRRFHPAKRNGFLKRYNLPEGFNLLYVGRVSPEKNLDTLAQALRQVRQAGLAVNLVVAGDGPYHQELAGLLAGLPVVLPGYVHGEELSALYASCDCLVFPSETDTFGNVVLEAQASGLPVIVSPHGGPRENVMDGQTGLVAHIGDADDYAQAISRLAQDPELARTMGTAARKAMEQRSSESAFIRTWQRYSRTA